MVLSWVFFFYMSACLALMAYISGSRDYVALAELWGLDYVIAQKDMMTQQIEHVVVLLDEKHYVILSICNTEELLV